MRRRTTSCVGPSVALVASLLACTGQTRTFSDAPPARGVAADGSLAPAPDPPAPDQPGEFAQLLTERGWGCVIDGSGELWCWGHGPVITEPGRARQVETPGPVLALATDRRRNYVTCASFASADAQCWSHDEDSSTVIHGPFRGTAGATDIAVHANGPATEFVCFILGSGEGVCYSVFEEDAPEASLGPILDLANDDQILALEPRGEILAPFEVVDEYGDVELVPTRRATVLPGAKRLIEGSGHGPLCALDGAGALVCDGPSDLLAQLGLSASEPLRAVTRGHHVCALTEAGEVRCAGSNESGELGRGELSDEEITGAAVRPIAGLDDPLAVSAAGSETCVMGRDWVRCYGHDEAVDARESSSVLELGATRIMTSQDLTCVVDDADATWCWGPMFAHVEPTRVHLPIDPPWALLSATTIACFIDQREVVWGTIEPDPEHEGDMRLVPMEKPSAHAGFGREGNYAQRVRGKIRLTDPGFDEFVLDRAPIDIGRTWIELCALFEGGELLCIDEDSGPWGESYEKREMTFADVVEISGTCVREADGSVGCLRGDEIDPVDVPKAERIVATEDELCALLAGDRMACVRLQTRRTPHFEGTHEDVRDVAIGDRLTCVVRTSGDVECRGSNRYGGLGMPPPGRSVEGRTIEWVADSPARER